MQLLSFFRFAKVRLLGFSLSLVAAFVGGCGGGGSGGGGTGAPKPAPNALRVACVGDSLTQGAQLDNPAYDSYPSELWRQLGSGYRVGNFGSNGTGVLTAGTKPYSESTSYPKALAFKPQVVVFLLGTNDGRRTLFIPAVKEQFVRDYKNLIAKFKQGNSNLQLFICLPPPDYSASGAYIGNLQDKVLPLIRQIATDERATLIDLNTPLQGKPGLFNSGYHPNKEAAIIMATQVKNALARVTFSRPR